MVALQCHDVLHICTRLLPTEPPTQDQARRLPKDQLPRRVLVRVRTNVSVRSEAPSRAVSKSLVAPAAATLLLGLGQQLRTDGARRWAGARFDVPFCRCIFVLKRPSAQPKDTDFLKSSECNFVYTSGYKRKYHALIKEGVDKKNALAEARIAGQEAVSTWMAC